MSSADMAPNASTVGGSKKKNKKEKASGTTQPVQTVQPQPHNPRPSNTEPASSDTENRKNSLSEELKKSCDDLVDFSSDNDRSSTCSRKKPEEEKCIINQIIDATAEELEQKLGIDTSPKEVKPMAPPRKSHLLQTPQQPQTAKVAPTTPLQSIQTQNVVTATTTPKSMNGSPYSSLRSGDTPSVSSRVRNASISYNRGQVVKPSEPPSSTIVGSVAELVHDVIPISQAPAAHLPAVEKAEWVQISSIEKAGNPRQKQDVVVVGLIRGYQIWTLNENGECEEVLSERQGPIRACKVLNNNVRVTDGSDPYASQRPLMAIVDASSHVPDRQYCSVQIISLASGKEVHRLTFDEPICAINSSDQYMVVSLSNRVFTYEVVSFAEIRHVKTANPIENSPPAVAITGQMLAYADLKLNSDIQSSGGLAMDVETTPTDKYTDQVMSAVNMISRTMKSMGETLGATGSSTNSGKSSGAQGVVTVIDLSVPAALPTEGVISHWVAHSDGVSHMSWSPDQRLLLTVDSTASVFNVFLIMPHPVCPTLSAVQHLYKLHRGNTPAKVTSTSFSLDSRWLAIGTNHGTCHLFAVCPFGGRPNQRTHGDVFVNKESRFHRSAGLSDGADVTASMGPSRQRAMSGTNPFHKEHPVAMMNRVLAKCSGNARVGPFPPPLYLNAVKKIKDQRYSTDNLTAWATDITSLPISSSGAHSRRRIDATRISIAFASSTTHSNAIGSVTTSQSLKLLIARADANAGAVICEYELRPRKAETATPGGTTSLEEIPKLNATATAIWHLQRTKNNADMHVPMPNGSPLIAMATNTSKRETPKPGEEMWTPHVEIRTYTQPHRWIWQGPQFEFYEYKEEDSALLMSPSETRGPSNSYKSIPVVVGGGAIPIVRENVVPTDATRIECGSYTSQSSMYSTTVASDVQNDISLKIADAMREVLSPSPSTNVTNENINEEFFDTHSPSTERRVARGGPGQGSTKKSKRAPPTSAPPPPPSPSPDPSRDESDEFEFEMEMDGEDEDDI